MDMENNWLLLEGAGLRGRQDGWRDSEVHTSIIKVTTHWGVTCSLATTVAVIVVKVAHSCLTLCRPMVYTVQGILQARILEWGSLSLLQGIFPTQGSNPGLPHCRWILCQLSHKGSPRILEWVAYPFSTRSSQPRNQTGVSCIAGGFFRNWAIRKANSSTMSYHSQ